MTRKTEDVPYHEAWLIKAAVEWALMDLHGTRIEPNENGSRVHLNSRDAEEMAERVLLPRLKEEARAYLREKGLDATGLFPTQIRRLVKEEDGDAERGS